MALDVSIAVENVFTEAFNLTRVRNHIFVLLSGTWVADVYIQISADGGTTWVNAISALTGNGVTIKEFWSTELGLLCRVGVPTSDFTSGPVVLSVRF